MAIHRQAPLHFAVYVYNKLCNMPLESHDKNIIKVKGETWNLMKSKLSQFLLQNSIFSREKVRQWALLILELQEYTFGNGYTHYSDFCYRAQKYAIPDWVATLTSTLHNWT